MFFNIKSAVPLIGEEDTKPHQHGNGTVYLAVLADLDRFLVLQVILIYLAVRQAVDVDGIVVEMDERLVTQGKHLKRLDREVERTVSL